ncbi:hypothetical protein [Streptomyces sp. sk226]|uniref:hypothetical protein n=1 Tax=Streptomyces sp. sk226 TaxID=2034268 RepID=UPI001184DDD6|nr:hypothetical protein [Streptomyces sp. sk226]
MNDEQRAQPTEEDLRGALVLPGFELPEVFPLTRGQLFTIGLQPEDHSALAFLKLRDPRKPATKEGLAEEMRAIGWKMGKTRFDGIFGRLKAAGHIKHVSVFNPELGRPQWQIQFFANPSYNDEYVNSVIAASSQVGAESLETGDSQTEQLFETPETRISRGQKESQVSRDPEANPWKPAFPSGDVPAGQSRNSGNPVFAQPPPLPPGGGKTSSPYPLTEGARPHPEEEEEEGVSYETEELDAAADILEALPDPWIVGAKDAADMAPSLLASMAKHGWPSILTVNRNALVASLAINPGGMNNPVSVLRHRRIPNLPKYSRVAARIAKDAVRPAEGPSVVECDKGCDRGYVDVEDGVAPCECLPLRHAASA